MERTPDPLSLRDVSLTGSALTRLIDEKRISILRIFKPNLDEI